MRQNFVACGFSVDRDSDRADYLRYMANLDPQGSGRFPYAPTILWAGPEDYLSKTSAYLDSLQMFVAILRVDLVFAGVLTNSDAFDGPMLQIEVKDERVDRTIPLPVVGWRL
jgi:hypothetical protein